jgi:hypothetical protein
LGLPILENPRKIFEIPKIHQKSEKSHGNPGNTSAILKIPKKFQKSQN